MCPYTSKGLSELPGNANMHHKILNIYFSLSSLTPKPPYVCPYAHLINNRLHHRGKQAFRTSTDLYYIMYLLQHLSLYDLCYSPLVWKTAPQACLNSAIPWDHRSYPLSSKQGPLSNNFLLSLYITNISSLLDHSHHHTHACYFLTEKFLL